MTQPLDSVRVLAIEQYGAGPFGTQFLADLGAEVIKIENPNDDGDFARRVGPHFFTPDDSQFFHSYNRNKKSRGLDLSKPEGMAVFHDLVKSADAVASNLRGDVPDKLGLTYAKLGPLNPRIVCGHLSAYGRTGPRKTWPGFDYLMQAEVGFFSLTGEPDGPPTRFGLSVVDQMTGLALAYAVLEGVTGARASGQGRDLDVSLFDIAPSNLACPATWHLNESHVVDRVERSGHPSLTPCALYTTADGWINIMCNKEKFWPALCQALGHEEWTTDARFDGFPARLENRELVQSMLDEALSTKTTQEWLSLFAGDVLASPFYDIKLALDNPFVVDEGRVQSMELEGYGHFSTLSPPIETDEPPPAKPAPKLGAHTEAVLRDLGYGDDRLHALREPAVI